MSNAILIGCLATLGVIIAILLFLAGGYLWWRHKRSQLQFIEPNEDEESSSGSMRLPQSLAQETQLDATLVQPPSKLHQQSQPLQNNINRKLNGFLNLKTPLIGATSPQTKSPGGSSSTGVNDDGRIGGKQNSTNRSVSMVDMYIDNSEPSENVGQIHFSLEYDFQNTTLILKILQVVPMLLAIGMARPEPPSPYQYNAPALPSESSGSFGPSASSAATPTGSYGVPAPQYGAPSQTPVVHKHVYVHVPPPEPEYLPPRKPIVVPPPQKHYKIVFIKAPTPPVPTAPIIPQIPQNEEKTLVYVLVKKPEEQPDIVIPTPAPTQPSKPEVYFIRYKTQKQEAEGPYPNSIAPAPSGDYGAPSATAPQAPSLDYGVPH